MLNCGMANLSPFLCSFYNYRKRIGTFFFLLHLNSSRLLFTALSSFSLLHYFILCVCNNMSYKLCTHFIKCVVTQKWHAILDEIINIADRDFLTVPLETLWISHHVMIFRSFWSCFFYGSLGILFCMLRSVVLSCVFIKVLLPLALGPICALCLCLHLLGASQSGCMCHFLCKPTPVQHTTCKRPRTDETPPFTQMKICKCSVSKVEPPG